MKRGRPKADAKASRKAPTSPVVPPEHLPPLARAIFVRVASTLAEMNILTIGDSDIIAQYAEIASLAQIHKRQVDANGATQVTKTGYTCMSADYQIWRDCQKSGQKLLSDLGLTPASRTRVAMAVTEVADEFDEFLARRARRSDPDRG